MKSKKSFAGAFIIDKLTNSIENVFCDVTEAPHFIRFVFVTPGKYAEMDKAGIVCHPFDADNY